MLPLLTQTKRHERGQRPRPATTQLLTNIDNWCILYVAIKHSFLQQFTVKTTDGKCVMSTKKKLYYPTPEEAHKAHEDITEICEEMSMKPVHILREYWRWIEMLKLRHPHVTEFLELEPEEMIRRHKMGIEAAKVLVIREK